MDSWPLSWSPVALASGHVTINGNYTKLRSRRPVYALLMSAVYKADVDIRK